MPAFVSHSNKDQTFYSLVSSLLDRENFARWDKSPGYWLTIRKSLGNARFTRFKKDAQCFKNDK